MSSPTKIEIGGLSATLLDLRLPMGLLVRQVVLTNGRADLTVNPFQIELGDWGRIDATLTALDLAEFLNAEAPGGLRDFAVEIREGLVYVSATARVIVEVRATAVCRLAIREESQLVVELEAVEGLSMARGMIQGQLDQINPVLNVADLPLEVLLDEVVAQDQLIMLKGRARPKPAG